MAAVANTRGKGPGAKPAKPAVKANKSSGQPAPEPKKPQQNANQTAAGDSDEDQHGGELLSASELRMISEMDALKSQVSESDQAIGSLELRISEACKRLRRLEARSPTWLIWRMDGVAAKFKAARIGQAAIVDSPMEYVSRLGYRFSLRVCLNGEGKARGKYISAFVSICRGDFDCLLAWPFKMRIYLSIIDQSSDSDARRDLTQVIIPNPCKENGPFLDRPTTDRNPYFGIDDFASLDRVFGADQPGEFLRDDAMYFKLEIPSEDLNPDFRLV